MAIDRGTAQLLLGEHSQRPFGGSVLQLGRQAVLFNLRQLRAWAARTPVGLRACQSDSEGRWLDDRSFFHLLGFNQVESCDVNAYERATLRADLNHPVPLDMRSRFDVVFNGGTLEHIFNTGAAFANIHEMTKVGGRVIHIAPASNMIDHGLYSFSPTLFYDYYTANQYSILALYMFECSSWSGKWTIYDYLGGRLDNRLGRVSSAKMAGLYCVARRTAESTSTQIPAQSHFAKLWRSKMEVQVAYCATSSGAAIKEHFPMVANALLSVRSFLWRLPPVRRRAMPPFLRKS